jgi:hypothetical protein
MNAEQFSLDDVQQLRDRFYRELKSARIPGVEAVVIGGDDRGDLTLVVDVNALYKGGVPSKFQGYTVETVSMGDATSDMW